MKLSKYLFISLLVLSTFLPLKASEVTSFIGEKLTYKITWFGISAADATIELEETRYEGKECLKIKARVSTSRWFSSIYYVEDKAFSIIDKKTMRPYLLSVDYREGEKYQRKKEYILDWENKKMFPKGKPEDGKDIFDDCLDMFGAFYFLRMFSFLDNTFVEKRVLDGRRVYKVEAKLVKNKVLKTILRRKTPCFVVKPSHIPLDLMGVKQKARDIYIYFSKDKMIPVKAQGEVLLGSLVAKLKKIQYQ